MNDITQFGRWAALGKEIDELEKTTIVGRQLMERYGEDIGRFFTVTVDLKQFSVQAERDTIRVLAEHLQKTVRENAQQIVTGVLTEIEEDQVKKLAELKSRFPATEAPNGKTTSKR